MSSNHSYNEVKRDMTHQYHSTKHPHQDLKKHQFQRVVFVLILTAVFMVVEVTFGFITGSLALLADGIHMGADVASLGLTLLGFWFSLKKATPKKTFGFMKAEVLVAFLNSVFLILLASGIVASAISRWSHPPLVDSFSMIIVATLGLLVNLFAGYLLHRGSKTNVNLRGAFLHIMADTMGSVGTILAAVLMTLTGEMIFDPLISILISMFILFSAFRLMSETLHLMLDGVPLHLNTEHVEQALLEVSGVQAVHHLHLWALSSDLVLLTVHLVLGADGKEDVVLKEAQRVLEGDFNIAHTTIQIEKKESECEELRTPCY